MGLIDIETARALVLERVRPVEAEPIPLSAAEGRRLAVAVSAEVDVPGFDNSAMDGYAVRAADTAGATAVGPAILRRIGESRAGHPSGAVVGPGEAVAISTGAMLPAGVDAVVRVEDTEAQGDEVAVSAPVGPGTSIRRRGEDISAGEEILQPGALIGAAELGALAATGVVSVTAARRPRVSLLLTGDELVEPGTELGPGQIHDSNAYAVPPLATATGAAVELVEAIGDDRGSTERAVERGLGGDVLVVCGGVSVGEHDHVRPAFDSLGVEQVFWGVSLRPGKPTYFGVGPGGTMVFGLPGNPVSAMVNFLLFARPALFAMQGADPSARSLTAKLARDYRKVAGRAEAIRVRIEPGDSGWTITPTGPQGSHVLTSMIGADGLAFAPAEPVELTAGSELRVELIG